MLIDLSGLPGTGKTTIARELVRQLLLQESAAVYLRIDSIEQALRDTGLTVEGEGYSVAYAVAEDNLRLGLIVVADCVNPWPLTRSEWRAVAQRTYVPVLEVEIICSDAQEHRRRVETRVADIAGHKLPTWPDVLNRGYRAWDGARMVVDTARVTVEQSVRAILTQVRVDLAPAPSRPLQDSSS